jgi:glutaredoxin-related protein
MSTTTMERSKTLIAPAIMELDKIPHDEYNESSSIKSQKNLTQAILMRSQSDMSDKMLSVIYLSNCDGISCVDWNGRH